MCDSVSVGSFKEGREVKKIPAKFVKERRPAKTSPRGRVNFRSERGNQIFSSDKLSTDSGEMCRDFTTFSKCFYLHSGLSSYWESLLIPSWACEKSPQAYNSTAAELA